MGSWESAFFIITDAACALCPGWFCILPEDACYILGLCNLILGVGSASSKIDALIKLAKYFRCSGLI